MPGLKRHSIETDEEEEDHLDTPGPAKRPRLSTENENADAESSDDEDGGDSDVDSISENELNQELQARASRPTRAAANGIIESITCTNFMCHAHLHVELGPSINFVIGHNGSGKSAVLTALQICMGGKASNTNRANSLKAFIKEGQDMCTLVVRIKNKDGFQHEVYGDIIHVERTFTKTGTSGFKIKNSTGRTITTTKGALDEILDYYALSLDNPICVLTQDMSREFLANSTANAKYKFFIKGVQLEQLNQDYELLSESIDHVETVYEARQNNLKSFEKEMKETKRRLNMLSQQSRIRDKCDILGAQMAWAQVEVEERIAEELGQKVRDAEARIDALKSDSHAKGVAFERADAALRAAQEAELSVTQQVEPIQAELLEAKSKHSDASKEAMDAHVEHRDCRGRIKHLAGSITTTEGEITEEKKRLEEASGGSAAARMERFEDAKRTRSELEQGLKDHEGGLSDLKERKKEAEQRLKDHSGSRQAKGIEVTQAEDQLKTLQDSNRRPQNGFHKHIDSLISAIEASRDFAHKPVGPVGKHVELLKPEWSSVLERSLNAVLSSFIVTSRQDRDKLNSLMKRNNCVLPINIVSAQRRFDVSANEPSPDYVTIARVLNIDDDLVFNQLVIGSRIEQMMLIEIESEATDLMLQQRIQNVKACLTLDQVKPGTGHNLSWNSHGSGISTQYIDRYTASPRMKSNKEDQIRVQQEVVQQLQNDQRAIDSRHRELQKALEQCNRALTLHGRKTEYLKQRLSEAQDTVDRIQDEIDNSTIDEGRLNLLLTTLEEALKRKAQETEAYETIIVSKDDHVHKKEETAAVVQTVESKLAAVNAEITRARVESQTRDGERAEALAIKNRAYEAIERAEKRRDELSQERQNQDHKISSYIEQASEVADRVPVPENENPESLNLKLEKLLADVARYEKEAGGNMEQISEQHRKAVAAYRGFEKNMRQESDLLSSMKQSLDNRQTRWRQFRKYISARARYNFMILLSERAFRGKLAIDHDKHALNLLIQPNETESSSAARQSKTLSGGEKSFSTICLILSLWEAICAPVRCLDEYDVFMDSANRDVSTRLLITAARAAQERQFIFITPQSMTSIPPGTDIKIIKMRDPERGQTTLAFHS